MSDHGQAFTWGRRHRVVLLIVLAIVIGYSDRVNISVAAVAMREQLGWTQTTKGLVLSAFFFGYICFMFAGGWLAARFGGKRVLGVAVIWWSLFTLLTPLAAATSLPALVVARAAMGIGEATMFPAAYELLGRWFPPAERTGCAAAVNSGIPLGTVLGLFATGWIVGHYAWPAAFYLFGAIGLAWAISWFATVTNDPRLDARLAPEEYAFIARAASDPGTPLPPMPWAALLARPAVWSLVGTHFAVTWSLYVLLSWLPSYFRDVQGVSIANSGLLSAAPWLTMLAVTQLAILLSGRIARATGRLVVARKSIQCIGLIGSGGFLLLAQYAHSVAAALAIVCAATGLLGFCWAGYTANFLDLAPRHSSLLLGFSNTIATIPGIVGVTITGALVQATGSYSAAFALAAAISVLGALGFAVFGSTEPLVGENAELRVLGPASRSSL